MSSLVSFKLRFSKAAWLFLFIYLSNMEASGKKTAKDIEEYWTTKGLWSSSVDESKMVLAGLEPGFTDAHVCRITTPEGDVIAGKYSNFKYHNGYNAEKGCFVSTDTEEHQYKIEQNKSIEVLIQHTPGIYKWKTLSDGDLAHGAVSGGISSTTYEPSYICRGEISDLAGNMKMTLPGQLQASKGVCNIQYYGVRRVSNYQILVDSRY